MSVFRRFASATATAIGSPLAFGLALGLTIAWAVSGPFFDWSTTWQLIANTTTTIVTFLVVFLLQHAQNRDAKAMQLKLDEIVRALPRARNMLMDIEDASNAELARLDEERRMRSAKTVVKDSPIERAETELSPQSAVDEWK